MPHPSPAKYDTVIVETVIVCQVIKSRATWRQPSMVD
jgi:hypothetical protein